MGVVILGVRISHTGCVASAETIRSVNPLLDLAAIQGVFTAAIHAGALVDGQPVRNDHALHRDLAEVRAS